jgi:hypothetical protein
MSDQPASSAPDFTKAGMGAMGDVNNVYDASQQTTNNTTNNSSSTSHTQHEDKSQHIDQSVTKQTTIHHSGLSPMVLFALTCVIIAGFLFAILALKSESSSSPGSSGSNDKPAPGPATVVQVNMQGASTVEMKSPQPVVTTASSLPSMSSTTTASPPLILSADVGVFAAGQFTPRTSFKTNELLTLRLRVSRACQARVLYQPAQGDPMLMFPESGGGSSTVLAGVDVFIPDPAKIEAKSPDAAAFQLFHDTGSGPPIAEQVLVQIAEEPFAPDGAALAAGAPYRTYTGLTLAEARMRGATKLQGLAAAAAQAKMESAMSQKSLPFTIQP